MIQAEMQQGVGRAKNAVQDYMIRKLIFPKAISTRTSMV